jgi:CRP/FNR family transcriptional regulator, nitrogen oxide reductase regulator
MKTGRREFPKTVPGDHVIFIYKDRAELFAFVAPFIKDGLAKGERCIYVVAESTPAEVTEALSATGMRINPEIKRGALAVTTAGEFFGPPPFDAVGAIQRLLKDQTEAAAAGFTGLRLVGDWAWSLPKDVQGGELSEFESLLESAIGPGRLTIACMYRKDGSDPAALERLVRLHAKVIASDHVFLSLSAVFRNLTATDLQGLARSARVRTIRKGESYFHQGEPARDVYVLTNGMVKLVHTDPGGESVILRVVVPVQHFGDGRLGLAETVRFTSAETLEDSRALVWDSAAILRVLLAHPAVAINAIRWLEELLEAERSRLQDFVAADVSRRLARLILRLGQSVGRTTHRGVVIDVPLSRHDLAEMVITSPYTVSRILAEWRRQDIVDAPRGRIVVRDHERLASIAEEGAREPQPESKISSQ